MPKKPQPKTSNQPQKTLEEAILEQEVWTFSECLGLSSDYGTKVRMVIAMIYARGKTYVERDLNASDDSDTPV